MIEFLWYVISFLFECMVIIALVAAICAVIGIAALAARLFWEEWWTEDGN